MNNTTLVGGGGGGGGGERMWSSWDWKKQLPQIRIMEKQKTTEPKYTHSVLILNVKYEVQV